MMNMPTTEATSRRLRQCVETTRKLVNDLAVPMQTLSKVAVRLRSVWSSSPRAQLAVVLGTAAVLCVWQCWSFHGVRLDDPFISYRYGQNLVNGHGLVFNPGQRFLGATSPAHMLLSAAVYFGFGTQLTPSIIAILSCLAWSVQAAAVFALLASPVGRFHALLVALVVDLGGAESFKWVPFETNIAMACALLSVVALEKERTFLSGLLLGLGTLFRPEIALLAALVFGSYALRRTAALPMAITPFVALVGSWVAFAIAYYGSALPHSALEKFQRTTLPVYLEHAWRHVGEAVLPVGSGLWQTVLAWLLCVTGAVLLSRRSSALLLLTVFAFLHLLAFTFFLRPFVEHGWHLYPAVLGAVVCAAGGLAWLGGKAAVSSLRVIANIGLCGLLVAVAARSVRASVELEHDYWTGARDLVYQDVARYLRERQREEDEFASVEVGTISYYSQRSAYDLGGLITDLKTDPMARHPVRWLVLDKRYMYTAPPWPPVYIASEGQFSAYVFEMPVRSQPHE